jgi:hypothetical protein
MERSGLTSRRRGTVQVLFQALNQAMLPAAAASDDCAHTQGGHAQERAPEWNRSSLPLVHAEQSLTTPPEQNNKASIVVSAPLTSAFITSSRGAAGDGGPEQPQVSASAREDYLVHGRSPAWQKVDATCTADRACATSSLTHPPPAGGTHPGSCIAPPCHAGGPHQLTSISRCFGTQCSGWL